MTTMQHVPDPSLDLILERIVNAPKNLLWKAWTTPELLKQWFTPAPWTTADCTIDLRPGGIFRTVMQGPNGEEFAGAGCYLEVVEHEKLVWTTVLGPGFRPQLQMGESIQFTAVITMEDHPNGTKYTVLVIHGDEETKKAHDSMGFHSGWGKALDQLIALVGPG